MRHYDYSQPGYYFVTICTKDKKCIFGMPGQLNQCGQIAQQCFQDIEKHFPDIRIDKWVVMPNHIHGIIVLGGRSADLPAVIGQFKSAVTRKIRMVKKDLEVWQVSFHDHVIRDQHDYERIWNYIDTNPMRWQDDCFYAQQSR